MSARIVGFALLGLGLWGAVILEGPLRRLRISLPIVYVAIGWAIFKLPLGLPAIDPVANATHAEIIEYATEFIVIVSLMAAGLAIDRPLTWAGWRPAWPLIGITLPVSIVVVALSGWWFLGLAGPAAMLLGAALSPTDPVLAESVQVEPPGQGERNDVRFDLTVEAGINDGLAFPFTYLALAAIGTSGLGAWTVNWFLLDVVWRIFAGVLVGVAVAKIGRWYVFERLARDAEPGNEGIERHAGLVVTATLLVAYGLAELVEGYGFLAVFVGAVMARQAEPDSNFHERTHHFIDQLEKMILVALLFGFGGLLASQILVPLTLPILALVFAIIFMVRPLIGWVSMRSSGLRKPGRFAVAFLGIRGMGSIYYLAYAQNHGEFDHLDVLWATTSALILASVVVHGLSAHRLLAWARSEDAHTAKV